jgi:hypothetical protein
LSKPTPDQFSGLLSIDLSTTTRESDHVHLGHVTDTTGVSRCHYGVSAGSRQRSQ